MWKQLALTTGLLMPAGMSHGAVRGLYGSDCLAVESISATKDLLFKEQSLEILQTFYADQSCERPTYDISFTGPYAINLDLSAVNYRYGSIRLRVLDATLLEPFNRMAICGITDWTLNAAREISGLECAGQTFPKAGTLIYDSIQEDPKTGAVQMGLGDDLHDGSSPEARPQAFAPQIFHAK